MRQQRTEIIEGGLGWGRGGGGSWAYKKECTKETERR